MNPDKGPQFALGTFSTAGGTLFAGLVLGESAAPLEKLVPRTRFPSYRRERPSVGTITAGKLGREFGVAARNRGVTPRRQ